MGLKIKRGSRNHRNRSQRKSQRRAAFAKRDIPTGMVPIIMPASKRPIIDEETPR
ncbi:MAG: hypothetical protein ISN29_00035 [Gammaproteobacteria bacterium AqS3]|nr:hypothetical protein [Gammaproteobacteria bacterium AqS3]